MPSLLTNQPAQVAVDAGPALDLDARMALTNAEMTGRLDIAAVGFEVNTAHIPTTRVDLAEVITTPITPTAPAPAPYPTPVAALLQAAQQLLATRGWCTGQLVDEDSAVCLRGAIRAAAHGDRGLEHQAIDILLEAIRRRYAAETVASWNDGQRDARVPMRMLGEAAVLADTRGL